VDDAFDVGLVTEKSDAVGLLGIPGHKRKIVEQINPANSCAEVGQGLLRRGESLIMEFFDDGEARTPEGEGQSNRRESDEDNAFHAHLRLFETSLSSTQPRSKPFPAEKYRYRKVRRTLSELTGGPGFTK